MSEYSLANSSSYDFESKDVILIDDIITTGYTMYAL
jgi:predicted amidophosphoribosyltransferase